MSSTVYAYDLGDIEELNMQDFNQTFIFVVNMRRDDYKLIDNPYVEVHANKAKSGWVVSLNEEIGIRECRQNELENIVSELNEYSYVTNAVCIDDYSQLKLKSNFYENEYNVPFFLISEC